MADVMIHLKNLEGDSPEKAIVLDVSNKTKIDLKGKVLTIVIDEDFFDDENKSTYVFIDETSASLCLASIVNTINAVVYR